MIAFSSNITAILRIAIVAFSTLPALVQAAEFPITYETASANAKPRYRASHAMFPPREKIIASAVGLVGDGKTDNTEAFRRLFSKPGVNVVIGPGNYRTGRFVILGDTIVTMGPNTTIRDSGQLKGNEPLIQIYGNHVKIEGNGAKVLEDRADYSTGEARHGIYIINVSDVLIRGLESSGAGGDGFYIGGKPGQPATNITLIDCTARNNRRHGLSIVNGRHVDIINSTFSGSVGIAPAFGLDLEPSFKTDVLDGILLFGIRTAENQGGGVVLYLNQLNAASAPIDVEFVDPTSSNEPIPFVTSTAAQSVHGVIRYVKSQ